MEQITIQNGKRFSSGQRARTGQSSLEIAEIGIGKADPDDPTKSSFTAVGRIAVLNNQSLPLIIPSAAQDDRSGLIYMMKELAGITVEDELNPTAQAALDAKFNQFIPTVETMVKQLLPAPVASNEVKTEEEVAKEKMEEAKV